MVTYWKTNNSLYDKYGGRVIFQQVGPEPLDAYRKSLEEHENKGLFNIMQKEFEDGFWNCFRNDKMQNFYPEEEGARFIETPRWFQNENK